MGRRSNSSDSEYSKRSSRRHSGSRSSSKIRHRDKSPDSKHSRRKQHRRSSSSESSSYRSSSHSKAKSSSSRSRNAGGKSHSDSRSSKHYSSSKRRSRSRSRSRSRDRDRRRDERDRDNRSKRERKRRRSRSRSSSSSSTNSSSSSSSSSSSNSKTSNAKGSKDVVSVPAPSKLSTSALLARIEEKLDVTTQITRQQAIDDIESDGFAPKSFKSTNKPTRLEDIPMPSLDLKPINLASLKNEVLCHPNLIITQREREEQWVKRLFSLRQRMFGSDMERIHSF